MNSLRLKYRTEFIGCISADALAKAQQIMIRNARKAEAARARYQRMTPEQRKEYNVRRAQSKKHRSQTLAVASAIAEQNRGEAFFLFCFCLDLCCVCEKGRRS